MDDSMLRLLECASHQGPEKAVSLTELVSRWRGIGGRERDFGRAIGRLESQGLLSVEVHPKGVRVRARPAGE